MNPRDFLLRSTLVAAVLIVGSRADAQINTTQTVAPGVYFHQGDPRRGHSNNGWIVLEDYVLVIDGNYPSGVEVAQPKIKETTEKPVRFVFTTHHHGDHAYGNQVWSDAGATVVASEGALAEMKRVETGYFGGEPGRWERSAKTRPDVAASKLKPPSVLFPKELVFDDGRQRVELRVIGFAHTRGDAMAWLPKEKILFTGDACVNGPHNNVADGNIAEWIKTLETLKQLGAEKVCPGPGPESEIDGEFRPWKYFGCESKGAPAFRFQLIAALPRAITFRRRASMDGIRAFSLRDRGTLSSGRVQKNHHDNCPMKLSSLFASLALCTGLVSLASAKTVVEIAMGSPDHTTLVAAVKAAGLAETLSGPGPFTVFAPTNAAFAKLPAGTVDSLLKPENKDKLVAVLTYHVVPAKVMAADVKTGEAPTVNGKKLDLKADGNGVMVNNAKVTAADLVASNGVVHVVDTVILP